MAYNVNERSVLKSFDELYSQAVAMAKDTARETSNSSTPIDAPFPRLGSSREWMAAEASRLYAFDRPDIQCSEYSPDTRSLSGLSDSSTRIEYDGLIEFNLSSPRRMLKRRDSVFQVLRYRLRRLSNSVMEALPVRLPTFRKRKTSTFESLEKWSWEWAQRNPPQQGEAEQPDMELVVTTIGSGNIC